MEERLDDFLSECGEPTLEVFRARFPHPFLFREVVVGDEARKPSTAAAEEQAARFGRIMAAGGASYVLAQYGAPSARPSLTDVVTTAGQSVEPRVVRVVRPDKTWPFRVGSAPPADLVLESKGVAPTACAIEPTRDRTDFTITAQGDRVLYDGERLAPGAVVRVEDGRVLALGPDASFQTFSPSGLVHFLAFRAALAAVKGKG